MKDMKRKPFRLVLITVALILSSAAPVLADGGEPRPLCYPYPCPGR
jgi:hypothetical protein